MVASLRLGVDTGGTFTDLLALCPDGRLRALKLASTPADPAQAVLQGVGALLAGLDMPTGPGAESELVHGTTVGTNALLERRGGPTALCTTAGFEDLLMLGRQARPQLYALEPLVPPPLCAQEHCLGVAERMGPRGEVLRALCPEEIHRLTAQVQALGVASVAVVLLHSYVNPSHERALGEALSQLGLPVSLSSEVLPVYREYERAQATVTNAYVAPIVGGYLRRLQEVLIARGIAGLRVLQSSGGAIPAAEAASLPVSTVLSGPAAGVLGAHAVGLACGEPKLITLDVGGTSTDVSLIDGEPLLSNEMEVGGMPLPLPMLAVHTVGAGGGSIAWVDAGGALQVGPRSAGAEPGPACYERGGEHPTLTDAALLLGRLSTARFCDGTVRLSTAAAARALDALARRLGMPLLETAAGVLRVASAVVARAIRRVTIERGEDPSAFVLLAFGGAGALHAAEVAQEVGIRRVLVPPAPGLLSAYGALCAPAIHERVQSMLCEASPAQQRGAVYKALLELRARVEQDIERAGGDARSADYAWSADLCYRGQSWALTLPGRGDGRAAGGQEADLAARFEQEHERRYGYRLAGQPVDLISLRLRGQLLVPPVPPVLLQELGGQPTQARIGTATILFAEGHQLRALQVPVLDRAALRPGADCSGPALVVEYSATTLVPPGWRASVDEQGAIRMEA
ncbi:MAG: hydantoinase/oxoprolinase family protein [Myxococcota bacterium]|nr:hydantoinase/oxoprolinase family protein [Myxococcota bacterium]